MFVVHGYEASDLNDGRHANVSVIMMVWGCREIPLQSLWYARRAGGAEEGVIFYG